MKYTLYHAEERGFIGRLLKFDPNQPRHPKGSREGGRFAKKPRLPGVPVYHGTVEASVASICRDGLIPRGGRGLDEWADSRGIGIGRESRAIRPASVFVSKKEKTARELVRRLKAWPYEIAKNLTVEQTTPVVLKLHIPSEVFRQYFKEDELFQYNDSQAFRYEGKIDPKWIVGYKKGSSGIVDRWEDGYHSTCDSVSKEEVVVAYTVILVDTEEIIYKFDKDQPRHPKGSPLGGQWAPYKRLQGPEKSDPAYVYHATNTDRADSIAREGLILAKPGDYTEQDVWPDGEEEKRNYFTPTAANTWQFAPEEGSPVLLRIRRDSHPFRKESGTGDLYSTKPVKPSFIEYLGDDDQWYSLPQGVRKAEGDSIVKPFVSFQRKGNELMQLIATLHTSRLSAYGFTAEAEVLDVDRYAISAQLDNRICPICTEQHGKTFEVREARRLLDVVLREQDPEALKVLQPWPKQDTESVAHFKQLSEQQMVERGWHIPPFHPGCRCLLVHVDKIPSIKDTPSYREAFGVAAKPELLELAAGPPATEEDFKAVGVYAPPKFVGIWNTHMKKSPSHVLGQILGKSPQEILENPNKNTTKFTFPSDDVFKVDFEEGDVFGGSKEKASILMDFNKRDAILQSVQVQDQASSMLAKRTMAAWQKFFANTGMERIRLTANVHTGGYAFSKYGWIPESVNEWIRLKDKILAGLSRFKLALEDELLVRRVLGSNNPKAIFVLADLKDAVGNLIGRDLLEDQEWQAVLNFDDELAMERFGHYVGA